MEKLLEDSKRLSNADLLIYEQKDVHNYLLNAKNLNIHGRPNMF
jgi:hypothetical protein